MKILTDYIEITELKILTSRGGEAKIHGTGVSITTGVKYKFTINTISYFMELNIGIGDICKYNQLYFNMGFVSYSDRDKMCKRKKDSKCLIPLKCNLCGKPYSLKKDKLVCSNEKCISNEKGE